MDFISLSRGGKLDDARQPKVGTAAYPYTGRSSYECMPSRYSEVRGAVRAAGFNTPVVVVGGVHNFEQAESLLTGGQADIVGLARQAAADPDWFEKVRSGHGQEVRLCIYTNYCEALDQRHRQGLDQPGIRLQC